MKVDWFINPVSNFLWDTVGVLFKVVFAYVLPLVAIGLASMIALGVVLIILYGIVTLLANILGDGSWLDEHDDQVHPDLTSKQ